MTRAFNVILSCIILSCAFITATVVAATPQSGASFEQVQQAAINGDPDAEYALGYMYYYGKGVTRDEQSAQMWIQKAAAQGQPQAVEAIKLLGLSAPVHAGATTQKPVVKAYHNAGAASVAKVTQQVPDQSSVQAQTASSSSASQPVAAQKVQASYASNAQSTHRRDSFSASERRLLNTPADYYTIQLLGSHDKKDILGFMKTHRLQADSHYYKTSYQGQPWYVLVYGFYKSDEAANQALKRLPSSIQNSQPWIKSIESVQQGIRTGVE